MAAHSKAHPANRHAAEGDRNKVSFSARVSADMADAMEESAIGRTEMMAILISAALAHVVVRTFSTEDGGWYAVWRTRDGDERETQITAATEQQARFRALVEWSDQ